MPPTFFSKPLANPPRQENTWMEAPSRSAAAAVVDEHQAEKDKRRADTQAIADAAAAAARGFEGVSGQGEHQYDHRAPAATAEAPAPKVGTGPSAAAERPATPGGPGKAQPYYGGVMEKATKDSRGRITFSGPEEAQAHAIAGETPMNYGQAVMEGGAERGSHSDVAGVARGATGAVYTNPSDLPRFTERTTPQGPVPYSQRLRTAMNEMPQPDLRDPGTNWTFRGGLEAKPGESAVSPEGMGTLGAGGAREGYRRLSGVEQAAEQRRWLEGRADEEAATELARARVQQETEKAAIPPADPLELARLQAEGRYGGQLARSEVDVQSREAAVRTYQDRSSRIAEARAELARMAPGSPEHAQLDAAIRAAERERQDLANLILGRGLQDPRQDLLATLLAGSIAGGPVAAPRPPGEAQ